MTVGFTHSEIEELLGAYALDAVDGDERRAVEDHLRDCPRCRAEVADHRETAAMLGNAGGDAPGGVWDRIAGALDEAPPELRLAPVVPIERGRRTVSARAAGAVAAVAAAVIVALGITVADQGRRIDEVTAASEQARTERAALEAFTDPRAERVVLESTDGAAAGTVAVLPDGTGYLVHHDLPVLEEDRTYQLWALVDGGMVSAAVLGPDPSITEFRVQGPVDAFAVTREPAGGSEAPSGAPVVEGAVEA